MITAAEILDKLRDRLKDADSPLEGLQTFVDEDVSELLEAPDPEHSQSKFFPDSDDPTLGL